MADLQPGTLSHDEPATQTADLMNPATFVAPENQPTPSVTIEFCDRVRLYTAMKNIHPYHFRLHSAAGERVRTYGYIAVLTRNARNQASSSLLDIDRIVPNISATEIGGSIFTPSKFR
jgi:hypothetical protein